MKREIVMVPLYGSFELTPGKPTAAPSHFPYDHDSIELVDRRAAIGPRRA